MISRFPKVAIGYHFMAVGVLFGKSLPDELQEEYCYNVIVGQKKKKKDESGDNIKYIPY